ncbi:MAG TPA: LCP family protein [Actinomycetota bacterium]|nr:LCP family protein [Actinomycetota bacterium]
MTRRRIAFATIALTVWAVGSALGTVGPLPDADAQLNAIEIGKAHAGYTPALDGSKPIFILALGSDARPGTAIDRGLSDSIHIIAINLQKDRITVLGFPRDSYVPIPGYGSNKINSAMPRGGPELSIATVEALTGITMDYYVLTSFEGVQKAVDDVGGLDLDIPFPVHDSYSRADLEPGLQNLNGHDVLAFARARHALSSGDFGRSENQGRVLIAALGQLRKDFAKDPSRMLTYIGAGMRNVQTSMSLDEVIDLAFTALGVNPKQVVNVVVPGTTGSVGTMSVVLISSAANGIYADLAKDGLLSKSSLALVPSPTRNQPGCC